MLPLIVLSGGLQTAGLPLLVCSHVFFPPPSSPSPSSLPLSASAELLLLFILCLSLAPAIEFACFRLPAHAVAHLCISIFVSHLHRHNWLVRGSLSGYEATRSRNCMLGVQHMQNEYPIGIYFCSAVQMLTRSYTHYYRYR